MRGKAWRTTHEPATIAFSPLIFDHVRMHALKGLACRSNVAPASSHASPCSGLRLRLRQSLSRTPLLFDAMWRKRTVLVVPPGA
jgi:hypothetical protein